MKGNGLKLLVSLFVLLFVLQVNAQERVVHGVIHTFDSIPLIGAQIAVKSTGQIVFTDTLGKFSVGCEEVDKLKITADGFFNRNIKLKESMKFVAVNLKLKPGMKSVEYDIGYGSVSEKDKTNAVDKLDYTDFDYTRYQTIFDIIKVHFAGVQIIDGEIIIRGSNTLISNNGALVVLDGVPTEDTDILLSVPTIDVKSISVIKDGNTAIYGSRGAGGVVIVETKKGDNSSM